MRDSRSCELDLASLRLNFTGLLWRFWRVQKDQLIGRNCVCGTKAFRIPILVKRHEFESCGDRVSRWLELQCHKMISKRDLPVFHWFLPLQDEETSKEMVLEKSEEGRNLLATQYSDPPPFAKTRKHLSSSKILKGIGGLESNVLTRDRGEAGGILLSHTGPANPAAQSHKYPPVGKSKHEASFWQGLNVAQGLICTWQYDPECPVPEQLHWNPPVKGSSVQRPPFWQGLSAQLVMAVGSTDSLHVGPVKKGGHKHVGWEAEMAGKQIPPFWQWFDGHTGDVEGESRVKWAQLWPGKVNEKAHQHGRECSYCLFWSTGMDR